MQNRAVTITRHTVVHRPLVHPRTDDDVARTGPGDLTGRDDRHAQHPRAVPTRVVVRDREKPDRAGLDDVRQLPRVLARAVDHDFSPRQSFEHLTHTPGSVRRDRPAGDAHLRPLTCERAGLVARPSTHRRFGDAAKHLAHERRVQPDREPLRRGQPRAA